MSTVTVGEPGASKGKQNRSSKMYTNDLHWSREGAFGWMACMREWSRGPFVWLFGIKPFQFLFVSLTNGYKERLQNENTEQKEDHTWRNQQEQDGYVAKFGTTIYRDTLSCH